MKIFPTPHKHRGPAVSVSNYGYETRVLRRCEGCGLSFTTTIKGNWALAKIQEAEKHETG